MENILSNYSKMEGKKKKHKEAYKKTSKPKLKEASSRLGGLQSPGRVCCVEQPEV